MAKLSLLAGTTSKTVKIFVQDSSVTTGAGLTGLVFNTASLTAYYTREGTSGATAISLVTATQGTWTSSGFIVVDGTNMPGVYELGLPNAALAAGAKSVVVMLKGATNMAPVVLEIELTAVDNQDAVRFALTALPNATAGANTGLPVVGTQVPNATAGAAGGMFIAGSNAATSITTALTSNIIGNVTGNLSGSVGSVTGAVGSVTGAVGSVTGNVGGNVVGSVASVTAGVTLAAAAVQAIWDAATSALTTAGSVGKRIVDFVTTLVYAAAPTAASNASTLLASTVQQSDVSALTTSTVNAALSAARAQGAGSWTLVGTTFTLLNPDGTTFRTFTLDSATAPTSRT